MIFIDNGSSMPVHVRVCNNAIYRYRNTPKTGRKTTQQMYILVFRLHGFLLLSNSMANNHTQYSERKWQKRKCTTIMFNQRHVSLSIFIIVLYEVYDQRVLLNKLEILQKAIVCDTSYNRDLNLTLSMPLIT